MRILNATWDNEYNVTKIKFCNEFKQSVFIVKADVLKDMIGLLQHQYNCLVEQPTLKERDGYQLDIPHPSDV